MFCASQEQLRSSDSTAGISTPRAIQLDARPVDFQVFDSKQIVEMCLGKKKHYQTFKLTVHIDFQPDKNSP